MADGDGVFRIAIHAENRDHAKRERLDYSRDVYRLRRYHGIVNCTESSESEKNNLRNRSSRAFAGLAKSGKL